MPVTDGLSTYVQALDRRGCSGVDLNKNTLATDASRPVRKSVAYERYDLCTRAM